MHDAINSAFALLPIVLGISLGSESATPILWWILGLAGCAVAFNQVSQAWRRVTGGFETRAAGTEHRKRADCIEIHKTVTSSLKDIARDSAESDDRLRREIKTDIDGVHRRIDDVQKAVSKQGQDVMRAIGEVSGQIKRMNGGAQ